MRPERRNGHVSNVSNVEVASSPFISQIYYSLLKSRQLQKCPTINGGNGFSGQMAHWRRCKSQNLIWLMSGIGLRDGCKLWVMALLEGWQHAKTPNGKRWNLNVFKHGTIYAFGIYVKQPAVWRFNESTPRNCIYNQDRSLHTYIYGHWQSCVSKKLKPTTLKGHSFWRWYHVG